MTIPSRAVALFSLLLMTAVEGSSSSSHLRTILLGRCYSDPDVSGLSNCPDVVETFLDVLAGHTDASLQADDFWPFFQHVDFSFPAPDEQGQQPFSAMIWLKFLGNAIDFPIPFAFVTPETTPGGKMMKDLIFCGTNQDNCHIENSRAYWEFWQAAHYEFTKSLNYRAHHLTIVLEPHSDIQFLERSVTPFLQGNIQTVQAVTIYETTGNCSAGNVLKLIKVLEIQQMTDIVCRQELWELWDRRGTVYSKEEDLWKKRHAGSGDVVGPGETILVLLGYVVLVMGVYYCAVAVLPKAKKEEDTEYHGGERQYLLGTEKKKKKVAFSDDCTQSPSSVDSAESKNLLVQEDFQMQ